jgi:hypothetical protein
VKSAVLVLHAANDVRLQSILVLVLQAINDAFISAITATKHATSSQHTTAVAVSLSFGCCSHGHTMSCYNLMQYNQAAKLFADGQSEILTEIKRVEGIIKSIQAAAKNVDNAENGGVSRIGRADRNHTR